MRRCCRGDGNAGAPRDLLKEPPDRGFKVDQGDAHEGEELPQKQATLGFRTPLQTHTERERERENMPCNDRIHAVSPYDDRKSLSE